VNIIYSWRYYDVILKSKPGHICSTVMKQRHCILFDRRCKNTCYYFVGKRVVFFLPPL